MSISLSLVVISFHIY